MAVLTSCITTLSWIFPEILHAESVDNFCQLCNHGSDRLAIYSLTRYAALVPSLHHSRCLLAFVVIHGVACLAAEEKPIARAPLLGYAEVMSAESRSMQGAAALGRRIFEDRSLSQPIGQSCQSCHDAQHAFADPRAVSLGAVAGKEGARNAPSLMYAALIPSLMRDEKIDEQGAEVFIPEGGLFYDGRANDIFQQVQSPFFSSNEMNLPNAAELAKRLRHAAYAKEFQQWLGAAAWADDAQVNHYGFRALAEFLKEPLFRPFSARIDRYLDGDDAALNAAEKRGLEVFQHAGKCAQCHLLESDAWPHPLLSDFGYDNLGVPSRGKADLGLGGITGRKEEVGLFRAPSLRNIELTAPYMHNGSLATLREVIEFYNRRDLQKERWGTTDYPATVNHKDAGNLGLSEQQENDLVALMSAFTDETLLVMKAQKLTMPTAAPNTPSTNQVRHLFTDATHRLDPVYKAVGPEGGKHESQDDR